MAREALKVNMLGGFNLSYQGKGIAIERNSATKVNQLLQQLLYNKDGVTRDSLMKNLFADEHVTNPSNSLRALVFRLRKVLKEQGLPEDEYVYISRGVYRWSPNIPVECDVHEFETVAQQALAAEDKDEAFGLLRKAVDLYGGEFLPMLDTCEWVLTLSTKYKKIYIACATALCEQCRDRREYRLMLQIAEKSASLYKFNEWQAYQMEALIALDRKKEALKLYEDTEKLMFEELGVTLSERMNKLLQQLGMQVKNNTDVITNVQKNLETAHEDEDGGFLCSYPVFVEGYRYIKRVIARSGFSAWLMLCTITDGKGYALGDGGRLDTLSKELEEAIQTSIRGGDVFTQYSKNQYLCMLMNITQEDCIIVEDRINAHMEKESRKKYIQYHLAPVVGSGNSYTTSDSENELSSIAWRNK